MNFMNGVSGARLHAALFSSRRVAYDIPAGLLQDIWKILWKILLIDYPDMEELLSNNRVWYTRLFNSWRN